MYFANLQERLVAELRRRVRGGEITERGLALLCGLSQPHVHNVLNGKRTLSADAADRVLRRLKMTVRDLWPAVEEPVEWREVPVLAGRLAPGQPFPRLRSREQFRFSAGILGGAPALVACRVGADLRLRSFQAGDFVLLEASLPGAPDAPEGSYYALCWNGHGILRRCRWVDGTLEVLDDCGLAEHLPPDVSRAALEGRVAAVLRLEPRRIG